MSNLFRLTRLSIAFVVVGMTLLLTSCIVVRHGEEVATSQEGASQPAFDAATFVSEGWDSKIVPDLVARAVNLGDVLKLLGSNPELARSQFGHRSEDSAPYNFVVKGVAAVTSVDLESSAATAKVAAPSGAPGDVLVQLGPVIRTSAIRDSLSFIRFGDFTNQVDFANLSRAINTRVKDAVLADLPREKLVGHSLRFVGAFSEDPSGTILITPISLEVVP